MTQVQSGPQAPQVVYIQPQQSGLLAALLSLLLPGLGQLYRGRVLGGLVWFFVVALGYFFFVVPGLVLHVVCIFAAAAGGPKQSGPAKPVGTQIMTTLVTALLLIGGAVGFCIWYASRHH